MAFAHPTVVVPAIPSIAAVAAALAGLAASPAAAQHSNDNAITSAEDAFGTAVGRDAIGLYTATDVRGFSPTDAGNVRLDGLYIDASGEFTMHMVDSLVIRVGLAAQGFPFPAPTGIADYHLRKAADRTVITPAITYGPYSTAEAEVDAVTPVASNLGLVLGVGYYSEESAFDQKYKSWSGSTSLRWQALPTLEIVPFWGYKWRSGMDTPPLIFSNGAFLPPRIQDRTRLLSARWATSDYNATNVGILSRWSPSQQSEVRLGFFRSVGHRPHGSTDIYLTDPVGSADHQVLLDPAQRAASWSGEMRATRVFQDGARRHAIILDVRGRDESRLYGGTASADLGLTDIQHVADVPKPEVQFGSQSTDHVKQLTFGLGYRGVWTNVGELGLGVQKTRYSKSTFDAISGQTISSKAAPWLLNAAAAAYVSPKLAVYGSYSRGLEEGGVAPAGARNKDTAPPAIRTQQIDAGIRYIIKHDLRFVAGLFKVKKPYFGLDQTNLYRQLGTVTHSGTEISLAGSPTNGLTVVAGGVLMDERLSGEDVVAGIIGRRPVGSRGKQGIVTVDYQLPGQKRLSVDAALYLFGKMVANRENSVNVPGRTLLAIGARYRFKIGRGNASLRVLLQNVFNNFGWTAFSNGALVANDPRNLTVRLTTDF
jgi:iron complex outermembrane receptor protein